MGMWVWPSGMYMADTAWATCSLQNLLLTEDLQSYPEAFVPRPGITTRPKPKPKPMTSGTHHSKHLGAKFGV